MLKSKFYSALDYDIDKYSRALYNARMKMGSTQKEFAEFLGLDISTYRRNESGTINKIPVAIVDSFCRKFDCKPDKLLYPLNPNCISTQLRTWLNTEAAVPYILNAYSQYKIDAQRKIEEKAIEVGKTL